MARTNPGAWVWPAIRSKMQWRRTLTEMAAGYAAFAFIAFGEIQRLLSLTRLPGGTQVSGFTADPFTMPRFQPQNGIWGWTESDLAAAFLVREGPDAGLVQSLLVWFHVIDIFFVFALARLLYMLLVWLGVPARLDAVSPARHAASHGPRWWRRGRDLVRVGPDARTMVWGYAVFDLLETGVALAVTWFAPLQNSWAFNVISVLSMVKWLFIALIAVVAVLRLWDRLGSAVRTARKQRRFVATGSSGPLEERPPWSRVLGITVVVALFVVLMALPGGSALTQLPDILRAGIEGFAPPPEAGAAAASVVRLSLGQRAMFLAGPFLLALAVWMAVRISTAPAPSSAPRELSPAMRWWWPVLVGAALSAAVALGLWRADQFNAAAMAWVAVPAAVTVAGLLARWSMARDQGVVAAKVALPPALPLQPFGSRRQNTIATSLAVTVLIAASLGLTRAALPAVLLNVHSSAEHRDLYPLFLGASIAGAVLTPLVVEGVRTLVRAIPRPTRRAQRLNLMATRLLGRLRERRWAAGLAIVVGVALLLVLPVQLARFPESVGPALGTTGVVAVTFSVAALLIALLTQASLRTPSLEALGYLRIRGGRPSWLGYLLLVWLVSSGMGGPAGYHDARTQPLAVDDARSQAGAIDAALSQPPAAGTGPTLGEAIGAWIDVHTAEGAGCVRDVDGVRTAPLILVASPGGGIRAAYWTGAAMDALFSPLGGVVPEAECASNLFALAGASGGSVGGTVRLLTEPEQASLPALREMSRDEALAANIAAMFFRDLPQSWFPAAHLWQDRAEVHERVWMTNAAVLTAGGSRDPEAPVPASQIGSAWASEVPPGRGSEEPARVQPGVLLLAASINDGCRGFTTSWSGTVPPGNGCANRVGDVGASAGAEGAGAEGAGSSYALTASHDLLAGLVDPQTWGRETADGEPIPGEPADLPAVTAAFLSARFPYVSPTGAVRRDTASSGVAPDVLYLADGGIYENTALLGVLQVWDAIEERVDAHNAAVVNDEVAADEGAGAGSGGVMIEPWLVFLPSGFEDQLEESNTNRPRELGAPIASILQRAGQVAVGETALLQAADARFGSGHVVVIRPGVNGPGITAPLGWVLSPSTQARLDQDLAQVICAREEGGDQGRAPVVELLARLGAEGTPACPARVG